MTHKKTRGLLVAAATGILITTGALWVYYSRVTTESIETMIRKEAPVGSSIDQVVTMLNAHGISSFYRNDRLDIPEKLKDVAQGTLTANIRNVRWSFSYRWDIGMKFYSDKEDRMIEYVVREVGTGP